jgi:DNA replication protein DnaC
MDNYNQLGDTCQDLLDHLLDTAEDDTERAELQRRFDEAAEAQRQRNVWWETHRNPPTLDGRVRRPVYRTPGPVPTDAPAYGPPHDWGHDGTELWDRYPDLDGSVRWVRHPANAYRCLVCRDTRYVRHDAPMGSPEYGLAFLCRCQTENAPAPPTPAQTRFINAGLRPELARCTLENFLRRDGTSLALNAVYALCTAHRTGGETPRWLILYGDTGTGKTHLLIAALQEMLAREEGAATTATKFLEACKADQFAYEGQITQQVIDARILLLDEVGTQSSGDWGTGKLEYVLNERYEQRAWTLLGMTMARDQLDAWSARLASRFADRRLAVSATLTCTDYRRERGAS